MAVIFVKDKNTYIRIYRFSMLRYLLLPFIFVFSAANAQIAECGTEFSAEWANALKQRIMTLSDASYNKAQMTYVPFQIHLVMKSDSTSFLTLQNIYDEIDSVNYFYANANIQFVECGPPEIIYDDSLYYFETVPDHGIMLTQHYTTDVINMYFPYTIFKNGSYVCGYAPLPASSDYVFISGTCATNGSTVAHELGHYFGLLHTHGGSANELADGSNCATEGDLICDTPADPTLSSSNVSTACFYTGTSVDANNMSYSPDVNNVMSYSRKSCRNQFSAMQYSVISNTNVTERNNLNCSFVSVVEFVQDEIKVYPNPADDEINFQLSKNVGENEVTLIDISGKTIFNSRFTGTRLTINTSDLESGLYFYLIHTRAGFLRGKFVKSE